ncbi:13 kDa deflagellation-inducible protein-like [Thrips palmi]|uniref:13 kDa deflagellation-inducible protein-like n=1 Tax=Thrips palmi TaxID=161013 RepID=A0A6P8YUN5_THRPL|nr:13 kDa deflagellation-inducible protein-like [Thrips palmi]
MSEKGAALQTYNQELVKGIESLKRKRCEIVQWISEDQRKKEVLEKELATVQAKLSTVCTSLQQNIDKKASIDESIESCESAYMKILESSQALLNMVRQDALSLDHSGSNKCEST